MHACVRGTAWHGLQIWAVCFCDNPPHLEGSFTLHVRSHPSCSTIARAVCNGLVPNHLYERCKLRRCGTLRNEPSNFFPTRKSLTKKDAQMLRNLLGLGMLFDTHEFQRGQDAANTGRPISDNPYSDGTILQTDWELGWRVATKMRSIRSNAALAPQAQNQSAYELGEVAAEQGMAASANPYQYGHPAHDQWRLGWARCKSQ